MPKAYLVYGVEASGNRMMCNLLVAAGCDGTSGYKIPFEQKWDKNIPKADPAGPPIVWLRSVPHAGAMPDIKMMVYQVQQAGYEPFIVVMTRAWWVQLDAHKVSGRSPDEATARKKLQNGLKHIFTGIPSGIDYMTVSYDELIVRDGPALPLLMKELSLPTPEFEFEDRNAHHYGQSFTAASSPTKEKAKKSSRSRKSRTTASKSRNRKTTKKKEPEKPAVDKVDAALFDGEDLLNDK